MVWQDSVLLADDLARVLYAQASRSGTMHDLACLATSTHHQSSVVLLAKRAIRAV